MIKRGILGGTFDPIHIGHLRLAIEAKEALELDEVIFEVTPISPFKMDAELTSFSIRKQMVTASIEGLAWARVGEIEQDLERPAYTIDTVRRYGGEGIELWFIMGSDSWESFPKWKESRTILGLARLAVVSRPDSDVPRVPTWVALRSVVIGPTVLPISSTALRKKVAEGRSIQHLVHASAVKIIEKEGLYRTLGENQTT